MQPNPIRKSTSESNNKTQITIEIVAKTIEDAIENINSIEVQPVENLLHTENTIQIDNQWLSDVLGESFPVEVTSTPIIISRAGKQAMGLCREDSIMLWEGAEEGTQFHEAFHRVSLLLLSTSRREKVYAEFRKKYGETLTDVAIEEMLADGFMEYVAAKQPTGNAIINTVYRVLSGFTRAWMYITNQQIDRLYSAINHGKFKNVRVNDESVLRFREVYSNGAPMIVRDANGNKHTLKNVSAADYGVLLKTLTTILVRESIADGSIEDVESIDFENFKEIIQEIIDEQDEANESRKALFQDVLDNYETLFVPELKQELRKYGLNLEDIVSDEEMAAREESDEAKDSGIGAHTIESNEVNKKNNARSVIKRFLSILPKVEYVNGKARHVINPITGIEEYYEFSEAWETLISNFNQVANYSEFRELVRIGAKQENPFLTSLNNYLNKEEKDVYKSENLTTQIITTLRSYKANYRDVNFKTEVINGKTVNTVDVFGTALRLSAEIYPRTWSAMFYNSDNVTTNKDGSKSLNKEKLNEKVAEFKRLFDIATLHNNGKPNPELNHDKFINEFVQLLRSVGIVTDKSTLYNLCNNESKYNKHLSSFDNFISYIADSSSGTIYQLFNSNFTDLKSNIDRTSVTGNKAWIKPLTIQNVFDKEPSVKMLAMHYAVVYSDGMSLSVKGPDNTLRYSLSENNQITDTVTMLNRIFSKENQKAVAAGLLDTEDRIELYNILNTTYITGSKTIDGKTGKGSFLIDNLKKGVFIEIEEFCNFKTNDEGKTRGYKDLSPAEDYVFKATLGDKGSILFPTLADKTRYFILSGGKGFSKPQPTISVVSRGTTVDLEFGDDTVLRFISYIKAEFDTISKTLDDLEASLTDESYSTKLVENYHKGKIQGAMMRAFQGTFVTDKNGNQVFIDFNSTDRLGFIDPNSLENTIKMRRETLAKIKQEYFKLDAEGRSTEGTYPVINRMLHAIAKQGVDHAISLGVVENVGKNGEIKLKNALFTNEAIDSREGKYKNSKNTKLKEKSEHYACYEAIAAHELNTFMSVIEFEKLFMGDPAMFKSADDKAKRITGLLSTGTNLRTDWPIGHELHGKTEYTVSYLQDNMVYEQQYKLVHKIFRDGAIKDILKTTKGLTDTQAWDVVKDQDKYPQYEDVYRMADIAANKQSEGYSPNKDKSGNVNQADAAVYISPKMYENLIRMTDGWTPEIAKAFEVLSRGREILTDPVLYAQSLEAILKPLKYMSYGFNYDSTLKANIPFFNKMALFPLFDFFSEGDGKVLYDKMVDPNNPIEMVAFNSALKVGQRTSSKFFENAENSAISDLSNMTVYKQKFKYLRRQLLTDPHEGELQVFSSQPAKLALSNIDKGALYGQGTSEEMTGAEILKEIHKTTEQISNLGVKKVLALLGVTIDENGYKIANKSLVARFLYKDAAKTNSNINIKQFLNVDENGDMVFPLSAMSDNKWIESRISSLISKSTIDINMPGGSYIQRSAFGFNNARVVAESELGTKRLQFVNEHNSMDAIISINFFLHMIPKELHNDFTKAKQYLLDNYIIGENAKPLAIGYRFPCQALASINALRVLDILPQQLGDTVVLPDGFTKLNGSNFEVDKLFVFRYHFEQKNGKLVKVEFEKTRVEKTDLNRNAYVLNSRKANENRLLEMYLKILTEPKVKHESLQALDTVTEDLKAIAKDILGSTPGNKSIGFAYTASYQSKLCSSFLSGSLGIGPQVLHNGNHTLTQSIGLELTPNTITEKYKLSNMSGVFDRDGVRVLDWLSATINGFVDMVKDPFMEILNFNSHTYNIGNFLIRVGLGRNAFYFMGQPVLKELVAEYNKTATKYGTTEKTSVFALKEKVKKDLIEKYTKLAKAVPTGTMSPEILKEYLAGIDKMFVTDKNTKQSSLFVGIYLKDQLAVPVDKRDFNWYRTQLEVLIAHEDLTPAANSLYALTALSRIDTKKHGENLLMMHRFIYSVKEFVTHDKTFIEPMRMFTETSLGQKLLNSISLIEGVSSQLLMSSSKGFIEKFDEILSSLGMLKSQDITVVRNLANALEGTIKGRFFDEYIKSRGWSVNELFYGNNSIPKQLMKLQNAIMSGKYPELGANGVIYNTVFSYLEPLISDHTGVYNDPDIIKTLGNMSSDEQYSNKLIRFFEELLDNENAEIREFAEKLAIFAFYNSGDFNHLNSFFHIVPNSYKEAIGFADFIKNFDEYDTIDGSEIIKSLWHNDNIVPYIKENSNMLATMVGKPILIDKVEVPYRYFVIPNNQARIDVNIEMDVRFKLFVKMRVANPLNKNTSYNNPQAIILYKYVGFVEIDNNVIPTIMPVYVAVDKKGLKNKQHVIFETEGATKMSYNKLPLSLSTLASDDKIAAANFMEVVTNYYKDKPVNAILYRALTSFNAFQENRYVDPVLKADFKDMYNQFIEQNGRFKSAEIKQTENTIDEGLFDIKEDESESWYSESDAETVNNILKELYPEVTTVGDIVFVDNVAVFNMEKVKLLKLKNNLLDYIKNHGVANGTVEEVRTLIERAGNTEELGIIIKNNIC